MKLLHVITLFFVLGGNIYLSFMVCKYRKMFLMQADNFLEMHDLAEKYKALFEEERKRK